MKGKVKGDQTRENGKIGERDMGRQYYSFAFPLEHLSSRL